MKKNKINKDRNALDTCMTKKSYLLDSGRGGRVARQNRKLITEIKVWK